MKARILILFVLICNAVHADDIRPLGIEINDRKHLVLKFPSEIRYADMGSADLEASTCLGNILKIKSHIPYFTLTNLSVVTTDGKYYSFSVSYNANPPILAIDMTNVKSSISSENIIQHSSMEVSDMHTSHIIVPSAVEDIAIGYDNIISEQAEEIDNIVKVKSSLTEEEEFFQTSIIVITKKGEIFPMLVDYNKNPSELNISFAKEKQNSALFSGVNVNDVQMREMAEWIVQRGQKINDIGMDNYKMIFQLNSVYTDQDIIAFYISAKNLSRIDYPVDFIKSYIRDKKITKKTAMQEEEIYPIYVYYSSDDKIVKGKDKFNIVLFYKKFTIPQKRILYFEMFELDGGRHIKFSASNNTILAAEVINK